MPTLLRRRVPLIFMAAFFALATMASTACQKKERRDQDSALVTTYKLIDAQRTDEAIALLESELEKLPEDSPEKTRLKVALASAYAHKSGIKVQKFGRFLQAGRMNLKFQENLKFGEKGTRSEAVDHFLGLFAKVVRAIAAVAELYIAIPAIKPEDAKYVEFSLLILDSLGKETIAPADAIYRAVVKAVYLKHYMATNVLADGLSVEVDSATCEVDLDKIAGTMGRMATLSIEILDDLTIAQPKKADSYQKARTSLVSFATDLTMLTTSASLIDEVTLMFTKTALVESGLRSLLKCTSEPEPDPLAQEPSPQSSAR